MKSFCNNLFNPFGVVFKVSKSFKLLLNHVVVRFWKRKEVKLLLNHVVVRPRKRKEVILLKGAFCTLILILYPLLLPAQILFNEFMIDPENDNTGEFIEIYNAGDTLVDLRYCFLCDEQDTDIVIAFPDSFLSPKQYGLILDPDYAGEYDDLIPDTIPRFSIPDARFGKYGISNSTQKLFALLNSQCLPIDTYVTGSPLWPEAGFTIERNSFYNNTWNISLSEKGTPGFKNSTAIKDHDLSLSNLICGFNDPMITIEFTIQNSGLLELVDFQYGYIVDIPSCGNSYNDTCIFTNTNTLLPGDSLRFLFEYHSPVRGAMGIFAIADFKESVFDTLGIDIFLPIPENGIIVTEFVAKTGDTFRSEYIEILNVSQIPLSLSGIEICDLTGHTRLDSNYVIRPDSMLVLAQSAFFHDDFPFIDNYIIPPAWRSLNNSEDVIRLQNPTGSLIFNLQYNADWDIPSDCAMQLVDTALDHRFPKNWEVSFYGSPGQYNVTEKQLQHLSCHLEKDFYTQGDTLRFLVINDGYFPVEESWGSFITPVTEQLIYLPYTRSEDSIYFEIDTTGIFIEGTNQCFIELFGTQGPQYLLKYYRPYQATPVFFNEVLFNPIDIYGQVEFIELESKAKPIDLEQWKIRVNNSELEFFDTLINTFTVICDSDDQVEGISSRAVKAYSGFPSLPNSGADLFLLDPAGRVMDHADLRDHSEIKEGKSLEKQFMGIQSNDPQLWASSVSASAMTPGTMNSITALPSARKSLGVFPKCFDPGNHDIIQFSVDSDSPLMYSEILCFDLSGQCIYRHEQNVFSYPSFLHFWDGKMTNGEFPSRGIYLIIATLVDINELTIKLRETLLIK